MQSVNRNSTKASAAHLAEQKSAALRPLFLVANAHSHPMIAAHEKEQVFAAVRACAVVTANAAEHRKRLAQLARLIPDFAVFRLLCLEDIRLAWIEDREQQTRRARSRRLAWQHLFKPFARIHRITQRLSIKALDRQGNYACSLADYELPDPWDTFMSLGLNLGIPRHNLAALYTKTDQAKQSAALIG